MKKEQTNIPQKYPPAFYFTKYDAETNSKHLFKYAKDRTVICFDLEDSVDCWIRKENNPSLKKEKREILTALLSGWKDEMKDMRTAVRINPSGSPEQINDIHSLQQIANISFIIIPKVNSLSDIEVALTNLSNSNLKYSEIIPVIESKEGLRNLELILKSFPQIKKIFFGHYDYNLDIKAFPFFHQDSIEYWKWVLKMIETAKLHDVLFINSPYTKLNDLGFFTAMLNYLFTISKGEFGQVTMNSAQTNACNSFHCSETAEVESIADNRHSYRYDQEELKAVIDNFENGNDGKAFTIIKDNEILSPHEYECAKYHLKKTGNDSVNLVFAGGCFPVQHNIFPDDTFHSLLKRELEKNKGINLNVDLIRYERFRKCFEKIKSQHNRHAIDYLVFHIRHEPVLRLIKFIYRFQDNEFRKRWSLNLPLASDSNAEKFDQMNLARHSNTERKSKTIIRSIFVNANYLSGWSAGNFKSALEKYYELIKQVINFCNDNNIKSIFIGPPKRTEFLSEYFISVKIEKFFLEKLKKQNVSYINGFVNHNEGDVRYFSEDGKHATEEYHKFIADALYEKISVDFGYGRRSVSVRVPEEHRRL